MIAQIIAIIQRNILIFALQLVISLSASALTNMASLSPLPAEMMALANKQLFSLTAYDLDTRMLRAINLIHPFAEENIALINIVGGMVVVDNFDNYNGKGLSLDATILLRYLVNKLQIFADHSFIDNVSMLFYLGEEINDEAHSRLLKYYGTKITKFPIFAWRIDRTLPFADNYLLFPHPTYFSSNIIGMIDYDITSWPILRESTAVGAILFPWDNKIDKIFWQGYLSDCKDYYCTSSIRLNLSHYLAKQQAKLVTNLQSPLSKNYDKELLEFVKAEEKPYLFPLYQERYKYLLSIDGAYAADLDFLWKLSSNSLVIKQNSSKQSWFYPLFKPYEHYIPIDHDLDELDNILERLASNPADAEKIAEQAQARVEQYMTPEIIDAYMMYLIKQYQIIINIR